MLGPVIGPILGGYLTETLSWHDAFINLPIGIALLLLVFFTLPAGEKDLGLFFRTDWLSVIGMTLFLGALTVVLEEGQRERWFESDFIIKLSIVSLAGFVILIWGQLTARSEVSSCSACWPELCRCAPCGASALAVWWEALNDPTLNRLEALALANSTDVAQARARILAAQATLHEQRAELLPQTSGTASYIHAYIPAVSGLSTTGDNGSSTAFSASSTSNYNIYSVAPMPPGRPTCSGGRAAMSRTLVSACRHQKLTCRTLR